MLSNNKEFLLSLLNYLASSYEEQKKQTPNYIYLPDNLSSDWEIEVYISQLNNLYDNNIIDNEVVEIFEAINTKFKNASLNGKDYEVNIWTEEGVAAHHFWKEMRLLAKKAIFLLEKQCKEKKI